MQIETVHLVREVIGGRVIYTSPDVPGLFTTHIDPDVARANVEGSIRALKKARGQDATVHLDIQDVDVREPVAA